MQLEKNTPGTSTFRVWMFHLQSRIHLRVHYTLTVTQTKTNRTARDRSTIPGSTSLASHSRWDWPLPLTVTWWRVCVIKEWFKSSLYILMTDFWGQLNWPYEALLAFLLQLADLVTWKMTSTIGSFADQTVHSCSQGIYLNLKHGTQKLIRIKARMLRKEKRCSPSSQQTRVPFLPHRYLQHQIWHRRWVQYLDWEG